ncbi:MAG TPA: adenylylsulfate reductase subunit alpha, partial [Acidiferrobacteraceae bacterium]|nr:adenylylsulfate reductase subunit alpha [Acidiferrobacteraceae bacterium]
AAVRYLAELRSAPEVDAQQIETLRRQVYKPLDNYRVGRNQIVAGTVAPSYISPLQGLQRLEKLMDEYVGGYSTFYVTNAPLLDRALQLLDLLREDCEHLGADSLHQLQRAWELQHRVLTAECVTRHTLFRKETRWPGYYYRADHPRLDDAGWHVFTISQYDAKTGDWRMDTRPVHHLIS